MKTTTLEKKILESAITMAASYERGYLSEQKEDELLFKKAVRRLVKRTLRLEKAKERIERCYRVCLQSGIKL